MKIDKEFWELRYKSNQTGWDIGYASPPIIEFMKDVKDKSLRILIPGAGNGYEAIYLFSAGFQNVTIIDISSIAVKNLKRKLNKECNFEIIEGDFFDHTGQYDIIIEQTFFCALHPSLRNKYVEHMYSLLSVQGYIVGVLFNTFFEKKGPPFGGNKDEYTTLFSNYFNIEHMDQCYNSIVPRQGYEIFVKMLKKHLNR